MGAGLYLLMSGSASEELTVFDALFHGISLSDRPRFVDGCDPSATRLIDAQGQRQDEKSNGRARQFWRSPRPSGRTRRRAAGSWQLVAQSTDRDSVSPSPSLIAEELWTDRNRVVARSTRRARVTWKLTCHAYDYSVGGIDSTRTAKGIAWVRPRVNRTVALQSLGSLLPALGEAPGVERGVDLSGRLHRLLGDCDARYGLRETGDQRVSGCERWAD